MDFRLWVCHRLYFREQAVLLCFAVHASSCRVLSTASRQLRFQQKCLQADRSWPGAAKAIPSMVERLRLVKANRGGPIAY